MKRRLLISIFCLVSVIAVPKAMADLSVLSLNTEWLWTPKDKKVDGSKFNKGDMSLKAYQKEINFYSNLVRKNDVDLVALSEIENVLVARDLARSIGTEWSAYFKQGRDTATGQDVAIVTRLKLVKGSVTNLNFPCGKVSGLKKRKCLSKVLALTVVKILKGREKKVHVLTSHFLSRRNDSKVKSLKRQSQSLALANGLRMMEKEPADAVIVLGDFNDTLRSKTIKLLMAEGHLKNSLSCSDIKKKNKRIDHVLYRGLKCVRDTKFKLGKHSDHDATFTKLSFK